jgi:hypothetical protein
VSKSKTTTTTPRKLHAADVRTGVTYNLGGELVRVTHVEVNLSSPRRSQVNFETLVAKSPTGRQPGASATWGIVNFTNVAKLHSAS